MEKSNLVSIIIPCYNQAQYLEESVQSAVDQTYSNIEIIIVNDGSPDNTQEIAEELQKKYPEKIQIVTQQNMGLSEARNSGIRKASGKYIVSLDSDDKLYQTMVEKCVTTIQHHNVDIVYTGYQGFGISDRINMWTPFDQTHPLYNTPCSALAFIKRKVWEINGGYKQNMNEGYEDWEFWVNAYKHHMKFVHIPEKLYYYRIKEESMVTNALKKDAYLKSKIVMNHPELYTAHRVKNAIETIRETEDLAELYFYVPKNTQKSNTQVIKSISHHLSSNNFSQRDHIHIDDQNIELYALDYLENIEEIKTMIKNNDTKNLFFYAPMRYLVAELDPCEFAWKNKSMIKAKGTFFPYVFYELRENTKLQLIAHKRLEKYHDYIQNKLNNLQRKYHNDMNNSNKKYENLNIQYTELHRQFNLIRSSISYRLGHTLLHEKRTLFNPKTLVSKIKNLRNLMRNKFNKGQNNVQHIPKDWPKDIKLFPLPESTNDFKWNRLHKHKQDCSNDHKSIGLSIIIPTFNRSKILSITLACLVNQKTEYPFEVIVADDGSSEDIFMVTGKFENELDIKLVKQHDEGYRLCAVRNLGLRTAKYDYVAILDCDMAPDIFWVQSYMELLIEDDSVALIGPRKYIDTHNIDPKMILKQPELIASLPEIVTNNNVAGKTSGDISVDWRLEHFKKSDNLRLCDTPFRYFSGGNVAFAKKWLTIAGWFDEEFTHWGGEDIEFGYRLYSKGCFFRAVNGGIAFHQEPPGKENETDRATGKEITMKIVEQKVPYFYRKIQKMTSSVINKVPLVSIYIPAYNCKDSIIKCIESALNQTITDLEVCVCDDGSTDGTIEILKNKYSNNPRVHYVTQKNGGIGKASNTAVKMAKGFYIGQLDSDDYLEPDAVEVCLKEFMKDRKLVCVYTTNRNVNPDGSLIANGYNWLTYSREKLATAMICHHFRMFTARAWNLTSGFDEKITNAVDYDMYLKLSDIGPFKHINKICYNRVLHGNNTSIMQLALQKKNHFLVVNSHLERNKIYNKKYLPKNDEDACRKYKFIDIEQ